ncbi:hypothetical protein M917_0626 [Psychrobacter aquaticus CMS 56]|uniref:Uncharacterized protein n=1 Tax=Psychrobacter aquaticus CMS 56 TaxID=1354303 RepID=U4T6S0_9GAMM|nr:hypothetical protein M917_0626 [Psychrobacter aquaticus CMS 56]
MVFAQTADVGKIIIPKKVSLIKKEVRQNTDVLAGFVILKYRNGYLSID